MKEKFGASALNSESLSAAEMWKEGTVLPVNLLRAFCTLPGGFHLKVSVPPVADVMEEQAAASCEAAGLLVNSTAHLPLVTKTLLRPVVLPTASSSCAALFHPAISMFLSLFYTVWDFFAENQ